MMPELSGWPVRNADGGSNIAHFVSAAEADAAIATARKKFRAVFSVAWFNT
jgi:hypothetical protein